MRSSRITKGGQIGFPSEIRRRWGTSRILLDDRGDHVILRPALDDPIAQLRGVFSASPVSSEEGRRAARDEEKAADVRRGR
ncbi:MAG: hypothetical protein ACTHNU_10310 [Gaiellales bacterium]